MRSMISPEILQEIKDDLKRNHSELYLEAFVDLDARDVLKKVIAEKHKTILSKDERLNYVVSEIVGLGVIDDIITKDKSVTDVSFNGTDLIVETPFEKYIHEADVDESYIIKIIQKFANAVGKEFTPKSPILDAALNNLRINAVHKTVSIYGTTMSIRVTRPKLALNHDNFDSFAPVEILNLLESAVKVGSNIVISGEVGTGKTELQKFLTSFTPFEDKIGWIEDVAEGHVKELFPDKDIMSWLVTPGTSISTLIKAMLRNNPRWINVTETRDEAAYEMIQAVLSGHSIITTTHTVNARAIPTRFVNMAKMGYEVDEKSLERDIYRYFHLGIHVKKKRINGVMRRYLSEIVYFLEDGTCQSIFEVVEENNRHIYKVGELPEEFKKMLKEYGLVINELDLSIKEKIFD